jgi:hypothetical protein
MSQKHIDKLTCEECESDFKLIYDTTETSGFPKFCPYCGSDLETDEEDEFRQDDEE